MGKDIYYSKDLYEAAFLYAHRQKLLGLEKDGKYFWFIFNNKSSCRNLSNSYWQGKVTVNAKAYSDAIRTLKDRVFAQKYNDQGGEMK